RGERPDGFGATGGEDRLESTAHGLVREERSRVPIGAVEQEGHVAAAVWEPGRCRRPPPTGKIPPTTSDARTAALPACPTGNRNRLAGPPYGQQLPVIFLFPFRRPADVRLARICRHHRRRVHRLLPGA